MVIYAFGRSGGRSFALRHRRVLRITPARLERVEEWFDRYGDLAVLLGRLVPAIRSVVSLPAGMARMSLLRFFVLTAVGSATWNALLIGAGWALGAQWRWVTDRLNLISTGVVITIAVALTAAVAWFYLRRRIRGCTPKTEREER